MKAAVGLYLVTHSLGFGVWHMEANEAVFGVPVFRQDLGCSCSLAMGPLLAAQMQHLVSTGSVSQPLVLLEETPDFPLLS